MTTPANPNTPLTAPTETPVRERKPYHHPRFEDYGTVNELTRSAASGYYSYDGSTSYISVT